MSQERLLIIEDDELIADLVCRVAIEEGFDVCSTCDFMQIQYLYDSFRPEVIILDIFMPGMDGFEVLKFLHQRCSSAHIVIMSGQGDYRPMAAKMAEGLDLSIFMTMTKPFRLAILRETLNKIRESLSMSVDNLLSNAVAGG